MSGYTFQLAAQKDIPEVVEIYKSVYGIPGSTWGEEYPNYETARSDVNNETLYVLKDGDKIIAAVSAGNFGELLHYDWAPQNPCEMARLGVRADLHRKGVGTAVLLNVIEVIKAKGYDGIVMIVAKTNPAAQSLYEKHGFERCGEVFMFDFDFYRYQMKFFS